MKGQTWRLSGRAAVEERPQAAGDEVLDRDPEVLVAGHEQLKLWPPTARAAQTAIHALASAWSNLALDRSEECRSRPR